ncbi:MAG: triose-phosphate isomerase, partial [Patescibacteria group bacterium]
MKKLIIGNWKMNPASLREVGQLMSPLNKLKVPKNVSVVICPPFVYLPLVKTKIALGAQDIFPGTQGAFTGEVSTAMVRAMGVTYVIIGHSERRLYIQEPDELIAKKVRGSVDAGLTVVLCVGESAATRKKGLSASKKFIQSQLSKNLALLKKDEKNKVIIAYEPIW